MIIYYKMGAHGARSEKTQCQDNRRCRCRGGQTILQPGTKRGERGRTAVAGIRRSWRGAIGYATAGCLGRCLHQEADPVFVQCSFLAHVQEPLAGVDALCWHAHVFGIFRVDLSRTTKGAVIWVRLFVFAFAFAFVCWYWRRFIFVYCNTTAGPGSKFLDFLTQYLSNDASRHSGRVDFRASNIAGIASGHGNDAVWQRHSIRTDLAEIFGGFWFVGFAGVGYRAPRAHRCLDDWCDGRFDGRFDRRRFDGRFGGNCYGGASTWFLGIEGESTTSFRRQNALRRYELDVRALVRCGEEGYVYAAFWISHGHRCARIQHRIAGGITQITGRATIRVAEQSHGLSGESAGVSGPCSASV
mmetsp:Transcript_9569/g.28566  ORF Transcript_9569/g.28566 Transcript_9569/m.28566 type:complete len:357 (-) Transcript_9569:1105-2175(-)